MFQNFEIALAGAPDVASILQVQDGNLIKLSPENIERLKDGSRGFLIHALFGDELSDLVSDTKDNLVLVSRCNGQVCGYALAYDLTKWKRLNPAWERDVEVDGAEKEILNMGKIMYLRHIARRDGFDRCGSSIMRALLEKARASSYDAVVAEILQAPVVNAVSTEFHEFHGFYRIGSVREGQEMRWGLFMKKL